MHVFPYSERSGTVASKIGKPVDKCVVKIREAELLELSRQFKEKFFNQNKNTTHKMLIEEIDGEYSVGYTENYIYTYLKGKHEIGSIVDVKLNETYGQGMRGIKI